MIEEINGGSTDAPPPSEEQKPNQLTRRQRRFADEYLTGITGAQAMRRIGFKPKPRMDGVQRTKKEDSQMYCDAAYRMLRRPAVQAYIRERRIDLEESTGIRQERVLRRLNCISEATPKDLETEDGQPIPLHEMSEEVAASIQEIEYEDVEVKDADGKVTTKRAVRKIKQHSPTQAAEQIARQLGWNKDALELKGQLKLAAKPPIIQLVAYDDPDPEPAEDTVPGQPPSA